MKSTESRLTVSLQILKGYSMVNSVAASISHLQLSAVYFSTIIDEGTSGAGSLPPFCFSGIIILGHKLNVS